MCLYCGNSCALNHFAQCQFGSLLTFLNISMINFVCLRLFSALVVVGQVWKILWRRAWQPTPIFLPGESHGQMPLAVYSPCDHKELDTTEQLTQAYHHVRLLLLLSRFSNV